MASLTRSQAAVYTAKKMAAARKKKTGAASANRAMKPALGNDPFVRGAAPRPTDAGIKNHIDQLEQHADQTLVDAEERLADLVRRSGPASYGEEVRELIARLLPALRERLTSVVSMGRAFKPSAKLDPFGMDPLLPERLAPLLDLLYTAWWRVEVRSAHQIPEGPAVVIANHGGTLPWDALVLRLALLRASPRRELRPLLEQATLDTRVFGAFARRWGAVAASPGNAAKLLADGAVLAVFPEGTSGAVKPWSDRYRLQRFGRGGFVKVALRAGAPIVPCAIVGSEEASLGVSRPGWLAERLRLPLLGLAPPLPLGPLALLPLPSRWSIRFGSPIEVKPHGPAEADNVEIVNGLTERTRSTLQRMLDEDVAARKSVFL